MSTDPETLALAWRHHQTGAYAQAEQLCRQFLQADPTSGDAWCLLGAACQGQGNPAEGESHLRRALELVPDNTGAWNCLGICLAQQGRLEEAARTFQELLHRYPADADAHNNFGLVRAQQQHWDEAIAEYQQALRLNPGFQAARENLNYALGQKVPAAANVQPQRRAAVSISGPMAEAANERGIDFAGKGKLAEAETQFRKALELLPTYAKASINLGLTLVHQQKYEEAIAQYQKLLQHRPDYVEAHYQLGFAFHQQNNLDKASASYREAVRLKPDHAEAQNNLGITLMDQGLLEEAIECYQIALRLRSNHVDARTNLGIALLGQGLPEQAAADFREALRLEPNLVDAHSSLGVALTHQGKLDEALACFEHALRLDPRHADAHLNRGVVWLLQGNWSAGWPEYEWRWQTKQFPRLSFKQPRWDGKPLADRTLLVIAEQGLGDTLHFIRYLRLLQKNGSKVVVQCQPPLHKLVSGCVGADNVVIRGSPLPKFDVYTPLLSLPGIFGSSPANVPAQIPYLAADRQLVDQWRRQLDSLSGFKVGIAWQGNRQNRLDRQRSFPLATFAPVARMSGVCLLSLQKGLGTEQLPGLAGQFSVHELGESWDEANGPFMDTAAVMMNLDLVISSDTAVAHLAGALGVPVWVPLPMIPDWRWLLQREDTPWYPTMRLFRQTRLGKWNDVFERMAEQLEALVKGKKQTG